VEKLLRIYNRLTLFGDYASIFVKKLGYYFFLASKPHGALRKINSLQNNLTCWSVSFLFVDEVNANMFKEEPK